MSFAAIFDMDGVLVDTLNLNINAHHLTLPKFGLNLTKEQITTDVHLSLPMKMKKWTKEHNIDINYDEYLIALKELQFELYKELQINKDLHKLLDELHTNKLKLGVATNSVHEKAQTALTQVKIIKYFDKIITSEDVTKHKPDPEMFLLAASHLKVKPSHCVVFEDAPAGVTAAKKAGMKAIGLLTAHNTREELKDADLIISSFKEINYQKLTELIKKQSEL